MTTDTRSPRVVLLLDKIVAESGGAERFVAGLARYLARSNVPVMLCATRRIDADVAAALRNDGVYVVTLGRSNTFEVWKLWRLRRLLKSWHTDVLHAHMFGSNLWGSIFGRLAGVPVVIAHEHTWAFRGSGARTLLDRFVIGRLADVVIAVSQDDARRLASVEGIPASKVLQMPVASPTPTSASIAGAALRTSIRAEVGDLLIVTAAMMRPQKSLDVLLRAFTELAAVRSDVRLVLVGDGPERLRLENLAAQLGIAPRTHFLGVRNDVSSILREADIAALSSDFEGSPLFLMEALAAGVPIVATHVGGVPLLVLDGLTGYLVPPRDPKALAGALARALESRESLALMSAASVEHARNFSFEAIADQYLQMYQALVQTSRNR